MTDTATAAPAGSRFLRHRSLERPGTVRMAVPCRRCGGRGHWEGWKFTGSTCYECRAATPVFRTGPHAGLHMDPRGEAVYAYPADWTEEACEAHAAKLQARREAAAARKAAKEAAALEAFLADHPDLAALFARRQEFEGFVYDVLGRLAAYGSISERQAEAVVEAVARDEAEADRKAAEAEEEAANAEPLPLGRVVLEGEVVSLKAKEGQWGTVWKMLLKGQGWKVWGSVPSAIDPERGDRVRLTATVEASSDDATFGFYSRPTKAEVLTGEG